MKFITKKELKQKIEILETINLNLRWQLVNSSAGKSSFGYEAVDPLHQIKVSSNALDPKIILNYVIEHWDDILPTIKIN